MSQYTLLDIVDCELMAVIIIMRFWQLIRKKDTML